MKVLLLLFLFNADGPVFTSAVEFNSMEACETALDKITPLGPKENVYRKVAGECVEKG